jgi:cytochrome b561
MRLKIERHHSIFVVNHWAFVVLVFASLALGWYAIYITEVSKQIGDFVLDIHTSIGILAAALLIFQIFIDIALRRPPSPNQYPQRYRLFANSLYFLIYASLILILISGYLQAIFRGAQVEFWGLRMPTWDAVDRPAADLFGKFWGAPFRIWGATDVTSAAFFGAVHNLFAFVLVGLIFAYIGCFAINKFRQPRIATPMLSLGTLPQEEAGQSTPPQSPPPITSNVVQRLAKNLRLFGWIEFWLQAVFAVFTALLLEFATSGRAFSPGASGFGDAIYWAADGFLLLLAAVFLAFYYTRAARKIASKPDSYLSKRGLTAFWFLLAGLTISLLGILVSFVGVALSISLLIAKTVSQPPGIAITDPSKIIRALDVFILLVNCNLLMAHFIGAGVALWLGLSVSSARLKYVTIARRLD